MKRDTGGPSSQIGMLADALLGATKLLTALECCGRRTDFDYFLALLAESRILGARNDIEQRARDERKEVGF